MSSILKSVADVFSGKHRGRSLGIDIGTSYIKVVETERVNEKAVLKNYGEIALGTRAGASVGQVTNLAPEKIAEALKDLLTEAGIVAQHTLFSIPLSSSLLSVIELPDVKKKELETMIPLEARRYIPIPLDEVSLDWWILPKIAPEQKTTAPEGGSQPVGKIEVIIAALHNEVMGKYQTIKQFAHIPGEASHYEIEIFSSIRAIVGHGLDATLVIDLGASSTKLALVDKGVVRGSHIISSGAEEITKALARSLSISFDQAEEMKCRTGILGEYEGRDVSTVVQSVLPNMMNEASRFALNYEQKYQTKLKKVILVGGGARLKGIEKIVAKYFINASIEVGDPFARVDAPASLVPTLKKLSPSFAVALGASLRGLEE
ncbi:MAG: type IV pilus assembly protein PilM [Candidatus Pacebacteria bacterium]|nr:type IV pilus assembly protein PilM [Candidatus Paceibacterota bacterium]